MIAQQPARERGVRPCRHDPPAPPQCETSWIAFSQARRSNDPNARASCSATSSSGEQVGEAERLKGYAIAVDVFGQDSEFDSSTDAVVRVQAGRLRELLAQYYATEGRHDPIRLVIPRGSYVPAYEEMPADWLAQDLLRRWRSQLRLTQSAGSRRSTAPRTSRRCRSLASASARSGCCGARWLSSPSCSSLVAYRTSPARIHMASHGYRRCAGSGDADRGHPRSVAVGSAADHPRAGRKRRSGDAARRCRVQGGLLRLRYAGPDR